MMVRVWGREGSSNGYTLTVITISPITLNMKVHDQDCRLGI